MPDEPQEPQRAEPPKPEPVEVEPEEIVTATDFTPDLTDLGTDAVTDADLEVDLPEGTEGSAAGERVHMEPSDIAVGHLGTEDLARDNRPQSRKDADREAGDAIAAAKAKAAESESGTVTEDEQDSETGFIKHPPISEGASRLWNYRKAGGVVLLGAIALFLFANRSNDPPAVAPSDQEAGAVEDPEPASDEEPVSASVLVTDPAGDNGRNGAGADIFSLEYLRDADTFTVLLVMGFSPLEASVLWSSYYLEMSFLHLSGLIHIMIWETHGGQSRSGQLDSDGNADGVGVTLTDEHARFEEDADPDDPVVGIKVLVRSLVTEDGSVAEDTMEVEVDTS